MDINRNGGKPDSVSPLNQQADCFVGSYENVLGIPKFVGLVEFDKADINLKTTMMVQVRGIAWYTETEDGFQVTEDDSAVFIIMEDTLPEDQNTRELTGEQHAEIGERIVKVLESASKGLEICTIQFRVVVRDSHKAKNDSLN